MQSMQVFYLINVNLYIPLPINTNVHLCQVSSDFGTKNQTSPRFDTFLTLFHPWYFSCIMYELHVRGFKIYLVPIQPIGILPATNI